jgi:molybdopterin converting factor small subunit
MKRFYLFLMFFVLIGTYGQNNVAGYEYWFDNNYNGKVQTVVAPVPQLTVNSNVVTSGLESGIHTLNIRSWDSNGLFSSTLSGFFYKIPNQATSDRKIAKYEYWFDNDYANVVSQTANNQQTFTLNTNLVPSMLTSGIHTFNIRFKDNTGFSSSTLSSFFYKVPEQSTFDRKIVSYEYWFDNDYANVVSQMANNQETFTLNTNLVPSMLTSGIHTFNIRFKDNTGFSSSTLSSFFYKVPEQSTVDRKIVSYEYWFDNDYANVVSQMANNQETFTLNTAITPSTLTNGVHTFNIRIKDNTGFSSSTLSSFFYKNQNQNTLLKNIVAYEYWFNDDYNKAVYKTISPELISNLDTFVIPENEGLGAGKKFLNIRFEDNSGLWSSILSDEFTLTPLRTNNFTKLENVVLYPNPTTKTIQIDLATSYENVKLTLFDMNGRQLKEQSFQNKKELEFELNEAAGIYLISITSENKQANFRIIKK